MKKIDTFEITEAVRNLCLKANCCLGADIKQAIEKAFNEEESEIGKDMIEYTIRNFKIAENENTPICQDTGMAVVFLEIGQNVSITGGSLETAVNEGVRQGYERGFFRSSVVSDPLLRNNNGDNTPAIIHYEIVSGDKLKITLMPKGFGSENMSAVKMLMPSDGVDGVIRFVVDTIEKAGGNACPPIVVGVGIGGTMEKATIMAKKALLRPIGEKSSIEHIAKIEDIMLGLINELRIGPQGMGGSVTALKVNIETYATHIAGLPAAVNIGCHANRHASVVI